ncbi:CAP domain-containing protein [Kitasatospora sp. NPDC088346]|uniref:CAP domain-containing protein n=1 Tax=Kitasatospora sp. NPDC088346 TaxID=3364073 RepID=UPI00381806AB
MNSHSEAETALLPSIPAEFLDPQSGAQSGAQAGRQGRAAQRGRRAGGGRRAAPRRSRAGAPLTLALVGAATVVAGLVVGVTAYSDGPAGTSTRAGATAPQGVRSAVPSATAVAVVSPGAGGGSAQPVPAAGDSAAAVAAPAAPASTAPAAEPPKADPPKIDPPKADPTAADRTKVAPPAKPTPKPSAKPSNTAGPSTPPPGGGTEQQFAQQVLDLTNVQRAQNGCGPLAANDKLRAAAQGHSDDMAARNFFEHTNPDGAGLGNRVDAVGYRWGGLGENIARGQQNPADVVDGWMHSPGHRANILNCSFTELGVGVHLGSGGPWWTQDFGSPA